MFVKICGITSEEDALLAVAMGADAVGFIFAPSPRQVRPPQVADIVKRLPPDTMTVGVFRDETPDRIIETILATGVRGVQMHGKETPAEVEAVRKKLPLLSIKAFAAASRELQVADRYGVDAVLIDAPSPGSGQVFDWRLAENVPDSQRVILAGGLTPDNVAAGIETVRPWGVDVVTGVESSPGFKDPTKVRRFVEAARAAEPTAYQSAGKTHPYDWREDF